MKNITALFAACLLAFAAFNSNAQTNAPASPIATVPTNLVDAIGLPPSLGVLWGQLGAALNDAQPYLSNDIGNIALGALYDHNLSKDRLGAFAMASVPTSILATNQTAVGFGGCYLGREWLDANVTLQLGTTIKSLPLIGSVFVYAASGPDYNFQSKSIGAFNFAGFEKIIFPHAAKSWIFSLNGGAGNISTFPGTVWEFGIQASKHF